MSSSFVRTSGAALAAAALVLAAAPLASADTMSVTDGDGLSVANLNLGVLCQDPGGSTEDVLVAIKRAGSGNVFANGAHVTLAGAGVGLSFVSAGVTLPADWVTYNPNNGTIVNPGTNGDTAVATGVVTVDTVAVGEYSSALVISSSGTMAGSSNNPPSASMSLTWKVADCAPTPTNAAPTVLDDAPDAIGDEGDLLATNGSFTDADGDPLTLTADHTVGDFTDNGDGTFDWSLATTDDVNQGSVIVTASDGVATASQTFEYGAANVAPTVDATTTATAACATSVGATITDPGTDDTHDFVIDWGDGSSTESAATPVAGSHTYAANGTYTATVTVTDDDGGVGSDTAGFATKLTPSALMQPINAAGNRSTFKLGSTIPVKITVTGCDDVAVTTLAPTVSLAKIDTDASGAVSETTMDAAPTNGLQMRWSDGIYIYNLSTKLSQHTGAALGAGTYKVSVNDPSFYAPSSATFDLRK